MMKRQYALRIATAIVGLALAVTPITAQQKAPVRVPRAVLERYVGEYDQEGNTIRVTLSGDTLFREIPGQRIAFSPISETMFRMGPVFTAEFEIDAEGRVTQILSDGIEVEFRLPRKDSRPAPPPPMPTSAVTVPRSVLEKYVGTYEYILGQMGRTDLRVEVKLKGDTLIRRMGKDIVLTPISETKFKVGNTKLITEFVVDEFGVTQVMGLGWQQLLARLTKR